MNRIGDRYLYSPSDLVNFTLSEFITWMDRYAWERPGEIEEQKIIQGAGNEHERAFLDALPQAGGFATSADFVACPNLPWMPCAAVTRSSTRVTW